MTDYGYEILGIDEEENVWKIKIGKDCINTFIYKNDKIVGNVVEFIYNQSLDEFPSLELKYVEPFRNEMKTFTVNIMVTQNKLIKIASLKNLLE